MARQAGESKTPSRTRGSRAGPVGATARPVGRPRGTGAERVYATLRARILSLDLRPGEEIDGSQTAVDHQVSRTLVREAFLRLEAEGLVQLLPNRSARVSYLELSEIKDLLE